MKIMLLSFPQIFALTFFLPEELSLNLFGLALQPYRAVLLIALLPAITKLYRAKKLCFYDWIFVVLVIPIFASMIYNHGLGSGFVSGGLTALEISGAYFIGRAYLDSLPKLHAFADTWILAAIVIFPVLLGEAMSGTYIFHPLMNALTGVHYTIEQDLEASTAFESFSRFGLLRAMGPFSHPILCGIAYAVLSPYAMLNYTGARRLVSSSVLVAGTVITLSSTAIIMIPMEMIACLAMTQAARRPWRAPLRLAVMVFAAMYFTAEVLSRRGPFAVLCSALALNEWTGFYRTLIWSYGLADMWANPYFGIGYGDWARPSWMGDSIDAYWLNIGMRHGVAALFLYSGATIGALLNLWSLYARHAWQDRFFRTEGAIWMSILLGAGLSGITVDYWGPMAMLVPTLLAVTVNLIRAEQFALHQPTPVKQSLSADSYGLPAQHSAATIESDP